VWFVPYRTIQSRKGDRPHPATFPVELPVLCLKLHGLERVRTVLDPFLGLGSTGRAARSLGLNFVGFDIDATYVAEARRALTKAGVNA
jgi:site-specific DNA-methyltransferase (adenine-specific)